MRTPAVFCFLSSVAPAVAPTSGGSVWWEWWETAENWEAGYNKCQANDVKDSSHHQEWTYASECLHSMQLRDTDPIRELAANVTGGREDVDVALYCLDDAESKEKLAASNITNNTGLVAVLHLYETLDKTCAGTPQAFWIVEENSCGGILSGEGENVTDYQLHQLQRLRIHCSTCNWYFLGESAPPYFLQAGGMTLFLIGCILVNFLIQDYLDLLLKILPVWVDEKVSRCLGRTKDKGRSVGLQLPPGCLAALKGEDLWCDSLRDVAEGPEVPRKHRQDKYAFSTNYIIKRRGQEEREKTTVRDWSPTSSPLRKGPEGRTFESAYDEELEVSVRSNAFQKLLAPPQIPPPRPRKTRGSAGELGTPRIERSAKTSADELLSAEPTPQDMVLVDSWVRPARKTDGGYGGQPPRQSSTHTGNGATGSSPSLVSSSGAYTPTTGAKRRQGSQDSSNPLAIGFFTGAVVPPTSPFGRSGSPSSELQHLRPITTRHLPESDSPRKRRPPVSGRRRQTEPHIDESGRGSPTGARGNLNTTYSPTSSAVEYREHYAPPPPLSPHSLGLSVAGVDIGDIEGVENILPHAHDIFPPDVVEYYSEWGMGKRKDKKVHNIKVFNREFPGVLPPCIVCGRSDRQPVKRREGSSGYKCSGICEGKPHDRILQLHTPMFATEDPLLRSLAELGCFGREANVVAQTVLEDREQVLLCFRRPRCWLRTAVVFQIRALPAVWSVPEAGLHWRDSEWPSKAVEPDSELEKMWVRLCETAKTFTVAREISDGSDQGWCAIELGSEVILGTGNVIVWVDAARVSKIGDWGGEYARMPKKALMKQMCESAGTTMAFPDALWLEWWGEFQLNVGRVRCYIKPNDTYRVTMAVCRFAENDSITLPADCLRPATGRECDAEYLVIPQPVRLRTMMAVFVASTPPLLACKAILLIVIFILSIFDAISDGHSGSANNHNSWEAYEEVYFKLFNSGYPSLLADCGTVTCYFQYNYHPNFTQFANGVGVPILIILVIATGIALPGLCTHAIPMIFYYLWVWFPFFGIIYVVSGWIWNHRPKNSRQIDPSKKYDMKAYLREHTTFVVKSSLTYLFFRILAELIVVIFLQTNFNYAVLTYEGRHDYLGVIVQEYSARTFSCVLENTKKIASIII
eukprot:Hpha_TRINITY_DN16917_c0_g4::TRINITY_DN16917_c0_g4_i1::g.53116::m.53116